MGYTLIQGDSLAVMKGMASGSFDLIVTSPPFNIRNSAGNGFKSPGKNSKWANAALAKGYLDYDDNMPRPLYIEWQNAILTEAWRLLRDNGAIYYNHHSRSQRGIEETPRDHIPLPISQEIIWARCGGSNPNLTYYIPSHQSFYLMRKPKWTLRPGGNAMMSVWNVAQERKNDHPAPYPVELIRKIMESNHKRLNVLDPFAGSMTTGIAAIEQSHHFTGIELSQGYIDKYRHRLDEAVQVKWDRLFGSIAVPVTGAITR